MQETAGLQIDVYPRLEQVEANLLDIALFSEVSKEQYRMLLGLLYARLVPNQSTALPDLPTLDVVCADVEDCDALTRPAVNVAYPQCYRQIAREYELPDRTGFWAQQDDIWNEFFRDGNWRSEYILRSLDATPEDRFNEFEVRAFYTQHALFLLAGRK